MSVYLIDEKHWVNVIITKSNVSAGLYLNFMRRQSNINAPLIDEFPFVIQLAAPVQFA